MHKTDLVRRVARQTHLSQRDVSDVVTTSLRLIEETLREGRTVTFPGFGTFYTRHQKGGKGKNFRTGKEVKVPDRRVAAFRVGEILKRAVRGERRTGGFTALLNKAVKRGPRKKRE